MFHACVTTASSTIHCATSFSTAPTVISSQSTETRQMPFIKTSKSLRLSPHTATQCIECLIRLVQANPTVTKCALLFTLISLSGKVGLTHLRSTLGSQRSLPNRFESSSYGHSHSHFASPHHSQFTAQPVQWSTITWTPGRRWRCELMCILSTWAALVCLSLESPGMQGLPPELSDRCCRGLQGKEIAGWEVKPPFTARLMFVQPGIIYEKGPDFIPASKAPVNNLSAPSIVCLAQI